MRIVVVGGVAAGASVAARARRLDEQARNLEATASGPSFDSIVTKEFANSHTYDGRSVFGWEPEHPAVRSRVGRTE